MKLRLFLARLIVGPSLAWVLAANAAVVYQTNSAFNHIKVVDQGLYRIMSFDGSMETRMSLRNPLEGHFGYIDLLHTPWIWRTNITNVLMIGLGGGSIQKAFQHDYPDVRVDTVEIDPAVVTVAKRFFAVRESATHQIHVADGRAFLEKTNRTYNVILIDAYTSDPAGSSVPIQVASQEFFEIVQRRLDPEGIVELNVMGRLNNRRPDLLGSFYKTLKSVFPRVYLFPATDSANVVMVGTKIETPFTPAMVQERAGQLVRRGIVKQPSFAQRVVFFTAAPPLSAAYSQAIHDDSPARPGLTTTQK